MLRWVFLGYLSIHRVNEKAKIKNTIETIESPFESGKFHMASIPKRSSKAGKKASAKRRQNKLKLDEDPEIDALLRIYGDRVNVLK